MSGEFLTSAEDLSGGNHFRLNQSNLIGDHGALGIDDMKTLNDMIKRKALQRT